MNYLKRRLRTASDDGFTLVEVVVEASVGLIIATIILTVLPTILSTFNQIINQSTSTQESISVNTQLSAMIYNSNSVRINPVVDGSQSLEATVYDVSDDEWSCEAWRFEKDGTILHQISDKEIDVTSSTGWTKLQEIVAPTLDDGARFAKDSDASDISIPTTSTAGLNETQILLGMKVLQGEQQSFVQIAQTPGVPQVPDPDVISCFE